MEASLQNTVIIDGSHGEGGGQIQRNSAVLACILRKKLIMKNIRAGREKPGLASQHLESLKALITISGAKTTSDLKLGTMEYDLDATDIKEPTEDIVMTIDLKTAGSITLCIQCILPYLVSLKVKSQIKIIGGTHVMKSPSFDYLEQVFFPNMRMIGYDIQVKLIRHGYYPRGGGIVELIVVPSQRFYEIDFGGECGDHKKTDIILSMPTKYSHAQKELKQLLAGETNVPIELRITTGNIILDYYEDFEVGSTRCGSDKNTIELRKTDHVSLEYFMEFDCIRCGFNVMPSNKSTIDEIHSNISKLQIGIFDFMQSQAMIDEYMQDQLIIYMALAREHGLKARIKTSELTDHTKSAIEVARLFTGKEFTVMENGSVNVISY